MKPNQTICLPSHISFSSKLIFKSLGFTWSHMPTSDAREKRKSCLSTFSIEPNMISSPIIINSSKSRVATSLTTFCFHFNHKNIPHCIGLQNLTSEGWLKRLKAVDDTPLECNQMMFIFFNIVPLTVYTLFPSLLQSFDQIGKKMSWYKLFNLWAFMLTYEYIWYLKHWAD